MAKALGRSGGRARARTLVPQERKRIAALGAKARLESLRAARRIAANFRYLAAVDELRGGPTAVTRVRTCRTSLPSL